MLAQCAHICLIVAQAGHQHVAQPKGVVVRFEPGGRAKGLLVRAARDVAVALVVELLHIKEHEVAEAEQFLHVLVPHRPVAVEARVDARFLQPSEEGDERFGLHGGLATREGDAATLAEEGFHADGLFKDIVGVGQFAIADSVNRIWVGTIQTAEGAALREDHVAQSRAVEGAHRFVGVYANVLGGRHKVSGIGVVLVRKQKLAMRKQKLAVRKQKLETGSRSPEGGCPTEEKRTISFQLSY